MHPSPLPQIFDTYIAKYFTYSLKGDQQMRHCTEAETLQISDIQKHSENVLSLHLEILLVNVTYANFDFIYLIFSKYSLTEQFSDLPSVACEITV